MADGPQEAKTARITQRTWQNIVIGGLALGALGLILPWVSAGFISANGLDTSDGKLYGVVLLVTAFFVFLWRRRGSRVFGFISLVTAVGMAAIAVYDVVHVSTTHGPLGISASPGMGLVLDAIAGVGTAIAIWKVLRYRTVPVEEGAIPPETPSTQP